MWIGLAGFKRAGKDTLGRALVEQYGYTRFAFADPLRDEVRELYGVAPTRDADKDVRDRNGRSYRDLLIEHGQRRRAEDPDYWVKACACAMTRAGSTAAAVFTDCRFPNEIRWIHANGGVVVWVARPGVGSDGNVSELDRSGLCDLGVQNVPGDPGAMVRQLATWLHTARAMDAGL